MVILYRVLFCTIVNVAIMSLFSDICSWMVSEFVTKELINCGIWNLCNGNLCLGSSIYYVITEGGGGYLIDDDWWRGGRAGLRHKLSKLQLRAPWYPKGPQMMKKGKKEKKEKKRERKNERKEKRKSENLMLIMITFQIRLSKAVSTLATCTWPMWHCVMTRGSIKCLSGSQDYRLNLGAFPWAGTRGGPLCGQIARPRECGQSDSAFSLQHVHDEDSQDTCSDVFVLVRICLSVRT